MLVNGESKTVRHVLKKGERLTIVFPPEEPSAFLKSEPMDLDIVYEDDYLLVVNKPAGIPVIPSHQYPGGTLANGALAYFEAQALASTVHIVNRLDRNTSGLMLIAKHRYAHELFFRMQRAGDVHRRYLAVVEGTMREKEGTIDAPIGSAGRKAARSSGKSAERAANGQ
ncbi:RluA family pseudouridine synthase [Terrilactibacillus sp. S3-3]|nr:RluA family pseudouridine synthase [Terrilactibacillus sp. S3-3]